MGGWTGARAKPHEKLYTWRLQAKGICPTMRYSCTRTRAFRPAHGPFTFAWLPVCSCPDSLASLTPPTAFSPLLTPPLSPPLLPCFPVQS